ncbi:tetratricopeptide repeat protein [Candidatus Palauibacter sp.]|uniref:tetratricopeptide repeat protein n=2 Tax=Candidatus Palauibacter sp. TaxID=3101350 RepID=UPI003B597C9A
MASLARNLFERRVPHVLVIYAGGSFALVEFTAFMVDEFLLSPHWTRVVLTAVLLLLPSVAMLAWFHGRQGRDEVPLAEKIGIPANLAVAATVLLLLFGGQDLGAATTAVSVETEDGETVERVVPKAEFRKRTALFPFDAGPGLDEEEAWLTYMAPLVLELDLAADDFFEPLLFAAFMQRLAELGFPALRDIPLSLKREVAAEFHSAFIVGGTIEDVEDQYRLTLTLHDAASGSQVSETVHEGPDYLALIDEMSEALADALEIPDRDEVEDLAVRERLTGNDAAWEAFGQSYPKLLTNPPDLDAAVAGLSAATALDPTFTIAQYQLAVLLLSVNRPGEAVAPIQAAMDHLYRLPERMRFGIKSDYYFMMQQPEKAWAVLEMWAELHPEDPAALRKYIGVQLLRGDWKEMVGTLGTLYRLNPTEHSLLRALAQAHVELGDIDRALEALGQYVERFPEDYSGYLDLARIQRRRGDHDSARDYLDRAIIMEPRMPELLGELASLDLGVGEFESALSGYEGALEAARTPVQRAAALEGLREYYRFRGEMEEAIGMADAWFDEISPAETPMQVVQRRFSDIDLYLDAGRYDDAVALFEELRSQLQPPLSEYHVPHWQVHIALGAEDIDAARGAHHAALDAMEAADFGVLRPALTGDLGRIEELDGNYDAAVANYRDAMAQDPGRNLHRRTGRALRKAGRPDEAEEELREALRLRPADPRAHLEMALVLEARGDAAGAVEHLRSALAAWESADESFEPAREARALLAELDKLRPTGQALAASISPGTTADSETMQFLKNDPDIPSKLLDDHEEGQVAFFVGAAEALPLHSGRIA